MGLCCSLVICRVDVVVSELTRDLVSRQWLPRNGGLIRGRFVRFIIGWQLEIGGCMVKNVGINTRDWCCYVSEPRASLNCRRLPSTLRCARKLVVDFHHLVALNSYFSIAEPTHKFEKLRVLELLACVICNPIQKTSCGGRHLIIVVHLWLLLLLLWLLLDQLVLWCLHVPSLIQLLPYPLLAHRHSSTQWVL